MYFLSFCPTADGRETLLAIVRKFQKNVRKHYEVIEFRTVPTPADAESTLLEIKRLYNDRSLRITKKLFSQDGRPTKRVPAHPKIIYHFTETGHGPIDRLRDEKIAVEGIALHNSRGWRKEPYGRALGDDYYVSAQILTETLLAVWKQKRLLAANECHWLEAFNIFRETGRTETTGTIHDIHQSPTLTAVALPVWFREKIRYSRPYRV